MEENFIEEDVEEKQYDEIVFTNIKESNQKKINPLCALAGLVAINLIMLIVMFVKNSQLSSNIAVMEEKLNTATHDLNVQTNTVKALNEEMIQYEKTINQLRISESTDSYIVNDQFIIEKSVFYDNDAYIDIGTQPAFAIKYDGYGEFSVEDRELKKYLTDLVAQTEKNYNEGKLDSLKPFKDLNVYITTHNYDVATYKNGELKLKGE